MRTPRQIISDQSSADEPTPEVTRGENSDHHAVAGVGDQQIIDPARQDAKDCLNLALLEIGELTLIRNDLLRTKNSIEETKGYLEMLLRAQISETHRLRAEMTLLQHVHRDELRSPRFLLRRLWHATWTRLGEMSRRHVSSREARKNIVE